MESFFAIPDDVASTTVPKESASLDPSVSVGSSVIDLENDVVAAGAAAAAAASTVATATGEPTQGGNGPSSFIYASSSNNKLVSGAPAVPPAPPAGDGDTHDIAQQQTSSSYRKAAWSLEDANEEIALLLESGKVTLHQVSSLQSMMRDHASLSEKVTKLKSLLGRSAKAQRESKVDLEATQKRLDQALREVERLQQKVDRLSNRPTHLELLADFETNFDRALLSVGQAGGQDTAAAPAGSPEQHRHQHHQSSQHHHHPNNESAVVDSMLMQELAESRNRADRLESLNTALLHRSSQLEQEAKQFRNERDAAQQTLSRMQLELRMAQMEAEHATRALHDKAASLAEMQMEIDLVTRASLDANVRAAQGEAAVKSVQTDRQHVQQLETQVQALQEWALASAEAKRLAMERVQLLENKLQQYEAFHNNNKEGGGASNTNSAINSNTDMPERSIFTKSGSLVIGAGDKGLVVFELTPDHVKLVQSNNERVLLRWKFDLANPELQIDYSILKGKCESTAAVAASKQHASDYFIQDRTVRGGAGGETEAAFVVQNACTLLWSNAKSWVRPRTVKYTAEAVAVREMV